MASGAVLLMRQEEPFDFIVDNTVGIEKGSFLRLDDARVASGAGVLIGQPCAGIARREKIANDGRTRLACFRKGIFDVMASGAVGVGAQCMMAEDNYVMVAPWTAVASGAIIIGTSLEEAADEEVFQLHLNI